MNIIKVVNQRKMSASPGQYNGTNWAIRSKPFPPKKQDNPANGQLIDFEGTVYDNNAFIAKYSRPLNTNQPAENNNGNLPAENNNANLPAENNNSNQPAENNNANLPNLDFLNESANNNSDISKEHNYNIQTNNNNLQAERPDRIRIVGHNVILSKEMTNALISGMTNKANEQVRKPIEYIQNILAYSLADGCTIMNSDIFNQHINRFKEILSINPETAKKYLVTHVLTKLVKN